MILPRKSDLYTARAEETRRQIDEGMALAKKVDLMRKMKQENEQNLKQWREVTLKTIQNEIDALTVTRDSMQAEVNQITLERIELKKPVDFGFEQLQKEKDALIEDKNTFFLDKERFQEYVRQLNMDIERTKTALLNLKKEKASIASMKSETDRLLAEAQDKYAKAEEYRAIQEINVNNRLQEATELKKSYDVGLETLKIKEKTLDDKEAEIITRENNLRRYESRIK